MIFYFSFEYIFSELTPIAVTLIRARRIGFYA